MIDLLKLQKYFILQHLKQGDTAIDFTMGNGQDTLFLAQTVGEEGHVLAFDIQENALKNTEKLLTDSLKYKNYQLILDSHNHLTKYFNTKFKAGMFNLGYLPGGDKNITTKRETTLEAIHDAIEHLDKDGILSVAVYPGHAEGALEGIEIEQMLSQYERKKICVTKIKIINSPTSPFFFVIETKESGL